MPLSRLETQRCHEAAAAAASGVAIRWRVQWRPEMALFWTAGGHEHPVCSSLDARYFWGLSEEAGQRFAMEYERLTRPRKAE
jgi:hypothetical protein